MFSPAVNLTIWALCILLAAVFGGAGFFYGARWIQRKLEAYKAASRAKAALREAKAREAKMRMYCMTQFAGTKASERTW
jgi:hypothetical protein